MTSESFWSNPWILASGASVLLGLLFLSRDLWKGLYFQERYELRHLHCPETGREVEAWLVRDLETGRFRAVDRCSAFPCPGRVDCGRRCLYFLNRGVRLTGNPLA